MTNLVLVDPVLLWHLRGKGLDDAVTVRLLRRAGRGSKLAQRTVERIAGITIDAPIPAVALLLENVARIPPEWRRLATFSGDVPIGNRLRWRRGLLIDHHGTVPEQVVAVMPGRPIGDLLSHPAIDGTAIATSAEPDDLLERHGVLQIDLPPVQLRPRLDPIATLRTWAAMRRQLGPDGSRMLPKQRWTLRAALAMSLASLAYFAWLKPLTLANGIQAFSVLLLAALMIDEAFGRPMMRWTLLITRTRTPGDLDYNAFTTHVLYLSETPEAKGRSIIDAT